MLFGAEHANVQPHSGAPANMAATSPCSSPGDTVLGLRLDHGGHLTHGLPVNFSGKLYHFVGYGVDRETEYIDMDEVAPRSPTSTGRSSSWPAAPPTRARSTAAPSARSPTRSAPS